MKSALDVAAEAGAYSVGFEGVRGVLPGFNVYLSGENGLEGAQCMRQRIAPQHNRPAATWRLGSRSLRRATGQEKWGL